MGVESTPPSPALSKAVKSPKSGLVSAPPPAPATACPSCDAKLLTAMAPHLWASPKALTDLLLPNASNVVDFSYYKTARPLPQCMRLAGGKAYMRKIHDTITAQLVEKKSAVVVGTSGVGKTMFVWLEVAQRLTRSEPCAWLLHDAVVLIRSAAAEVIPLTSLSDMTGFENAILFVDWSLSLEAASPRLHMLRPEAYALLEFCKGIIMATGPFEERWSDLQARWLPTMHVVVIPPWSFHEVHDGASVLMAFDSPVTVKRLVERFGSIPRTLLSILAHGPTHGDAIWEQFLLLIRRSPEGARGLRRFSETRGAVSFPALPAELLLLYLICPADPEDLTWENSRCLLRSTDVIKIVQERSTEEFQAERSPQPRASMPLTPAMMAAIATQQQAHARTPSQTSPGLPLRTPQTGLMGSLPLFP
ncbi:hypothetical protein AURDEDRAFT_112144 [Auricularia subglabra TFB-10046 SS5]|nr:hypothetical protein AURDEDRAFT_112144 [Auricularia subglabra TFB-10046 SS5]